MVTIPAFVWRGGFFFRALIVGGGVGLCLGALAWLDSGLLVAGIAVLVIVGVCYGIWTARRMSRYWPAATELDGADRVAVARAARAGEHVVDPRLAQAAMGYRDGMHAAADAARPFRWLLPLVLVVAVATAVFDAIFGSWGNAVVSVIYLAALVVEVFWWPRRQAQLLENADRSCG
ncbi:hypothetical protein [Mycolicibacterium sp.]|uniref:hypothetical protein n=1 Tax=Mycolicibacterium sp. TaxID=2320850 RepID=UPI0037C8FD55